MRRDLNTCSSQSPVQHGVRVRLFFRRSTTAETTAAAHLGVTTYIFSNIIVSIFVPRTCLWVLYNIFARNLEGGKKTPSWISSSAVAAAAAAEAAAAEANSSSSSSNSSSTTTAAAATAAEDAESTSEHLRMYTATVRILYSSIYFCLIFEDEKTAPPTTFGIVITQHTSNRATRTRCHNDDIYRTPFPSPHQ